MSTNKYAQFDSNRGIIRSTSTISLGTLSSRVLGFIRDVILARMLGTALRADAFFVAFRIPNLFRDMVGEGATNSAIVPIFSEYVEKKDKEELWHFVTVVFILSLMILSVITVLGIILAPIIVRLIAPGFIEDPAKLTLTIQLTRIMFPYLIFIGLTAYCVGILYTFRSFWAPAFSPCLLNIAIILSALFASKAMCEPVFGLAAGVIIGGMAQLLVQIRPLLKNGFRFKRPKTLKHPGAIKVGRLLLPRLFGAMVYQLTIFIDTFCASLAFIVGTGGISAIYYANRIIQFPMGVVGIALASAILPTLSGFSARNDLEEIKKTLVFSLENIFYVMFPASVLIASLSTPIIRILFQRGAFNAYSTEITSLALMFYALGLVSFGGIKIMVTAFYSLQDTKTPVKVAAWCLVINAVLNFALMWRLKVGGIALASVIAATTDFLVLFYLISKRLHGLGKTLGGYTLKILLASLIMGMTVVLSWQLLSFVIELLRFVLTVGIAASVFLAATRLLHVKQTHSLLRWIFKKA